MEQAQNDIGEVVAFQPESIGLPGKRTFRLLVDASRGGACLWLEKEQLYSMALSIQRMLEATPLDRGAASSTEPKTGDESYRAVEFKIGRMGMGYEEESDRFVFVVHDVDALTETLEAADAEAEEAEDVEEEEEDDEERRTRLEEALAEIPPTLSFRASRHLLGEMCKDAQEVCMGGRPICPLCNQPMEPEGHICPRTNGHHADAKRRLG